MHNTSKRLLSAEAMMRVDAQTIAKGVDGFVLMKRAGQAVAEQIMKHYAPQPTLILAGPGNNGGDGFIVAQLLRDHGWPVKVAELAGVDSLRGDAAKAKGFYRGDAMPLAPSVLQGAALVVDALFGSGLSRPLDGVVKATVDALNASGVEVVAIDIPSGIHGTSGEVVGSAVRAVLTVTFGCKKYGHVLLPGREHCGKLVVADIGLDEDAIVHADEQVPENHPELWRSVMLFPTAASHKHKRGHVVVAGGEELTGAARLAAIAALRSGAGLVTLAAPEKAYPIYAAALMSVMVRKCSDREWEDLVEDPRITTALVGPGGGLNKRTRNQVLMALKHKKHMVIDADALSIFADDPDELFSAIEAPCILTPHAGEFAKLFEDLNAPHKIALTQKAAEKSQAVVVLKGADTVIAAPDGRVVVNANAPAWLATAGSGDVLAGMCAGLLAQGMPVFDAACAAVWMHGEAANHHGIGMIAEDLLPQIPEVLRNLHYAGA